MRIQDVVGVGQSVHEYARDLANLRKKHKKTDRVLDADTEKLISGLMYDLGKMEDALTDPIVAVVVRMREETAEMRDKIDSAEREVRELRNQLGYLGV